MGTPRLGFENLFAAQTPGTQQFGLIEPKTRGRLGPYDRRFWDVTGSAWQKP
jgi:hypothetical protein